MTSRWTSIALRRYADATRDRGQSLFERLLNYIGGNVGYADDILGDLVEERARRAERDGERSASVWYVREAVIAIPHLAWNAIHHGGPRGRARVTGLVAAAAFAVTAVVGLLRSFGPAPARLEIDGQRGARASGTLIVNTRRPVFLSTRAVDASGQPMKSTEARYQRLSGGAISMSSKGVVACRNEGEAIIRASLRGTTTKNVRIKCRPVHEVQALERIRLSVGDRPRMLPFVAFDRGGVQVDELAGDLQIEDSTIALLKEGRVYPIAPGITEATIRIGDGVARTQVIVLPRVTPP